MDPHIERHFGSGKAYSTMLGQGSKILSGKQRPEPSREPNRGGSGKQRGEVKRDGGRGPRGGFHGRTKRKRVSVFFCHQIIDSASYLHLAQPVR